MEDALARKDKQMEESLATLRQELLGRVTAAEKVRGCVGEWRRRGTGDGGEGDEGLRCVCVWV